MMDSKYKYGYFDISNIYYRMYHGTKGSVSASSLYKVVVERSFKYILDTKKEFFITNPTLYFFFDNPTSKDRFAKMISRKDIFPDYKANRSQMPPEFYSGLMVLEGLLLDTFDGCYVGKFNNLEADDLVPPAVRHSFELGKSKRGLLVSEDLDWYRSLSPFIDVLKKDGRIITKSKFFEKFGFTHSSESLIMYKAIKGDSIDNIPIGIPRIRTEKLCQLINDGCDSMTKFLSSYKSFDLLSDRDLEKIEENKAQLRINEDLVREIYVSDDIFEDFLVPTKFRRESLRCKLERVRIPTKVDSRLSFSGQSEGNGSSGFSFGGIGIPRKDCYKKAKNK